MLRAIEGAAVALFVLACVAGLGYLIWINVHKTLRNEHKQDEYDKELKDLK